MILNSRFTYLLSGLSAGVFGWLAGASKALAQSTGTINPAAGDPISRLRRVGSGAGFGDVGDMTLFQIIGLAISVFLSLLGIIFIILILIAGYNWMTAAGNEEKIKTAGTSIRNAIIGLLITIGAFAIWQFVSRVVIGN